MKLKMVYLLGMLLSAVVTLYFSFEAKPVLPLWHWFGYRFSIGSPIENWIPKFSFLIFLILYLAQLNKETKKS